MFQPVEFKAQAHFFKEFDIFTSFAPTSIFGEFYEAFINNSTLECQTNRKEEGGEGLEEEVFAEMAKMSKSQRTWKPIIEYIFSYLKPS